MINLTLLTSRISNLFSMHPSRLETLVSLIYGMMASANVVHSSLSSYLSTTKPKSAIRRVERFFKDQDLGFASCALGMVKLLNFTGKFDLCLDRTNWKFAEKHINYLVLSWRINKRISIPLLAVELDKAGNSSTAERIDLLEKFDLLFGYDRINSLLADREFIGEVWYKKLIDSKIPFFIRVKENGLVPCGDKKYALVDCFNHLKTNQYQIVKKDMYGSEVYFASTRSLAGDLVIVITNQDWKAKKVLEKYKTRWSIEEMFRKLKTSGFNWENTHMKRPKRLLS